MSDKTNEKPVAAIEPSTLLECPCCGSDPIEKERSTWWKATIECSNKLCDLRMYARHDKEPLSSLALKWNKRHSNT